MAISLKQSTASQEILLGPFLSDTDGKTAQTGLTIANTDIKIWVAGGTSEASKNSGGATHIADGRYYCVLDATDTATLGPMEINVHVSGALPVRRECEVLTAAAYDAKFGTTVPLTVAGIADGVWDELTSGHAISGSTGEALTDAGGAGTPPTAAEIAEEVYMLDTASLTESAAPKKSLYGAVAKLTHKVSSSGGTTTVHRSDGTTPHYTQTETTDGAALPLTGLDGAA